MSMYARLLGEHDEGPVIQLLSEGVEQICEKFQAGQDPMVAAEQKMLF